MICKTISANEYSWSKSAVYFFKLFLFNDDFYQFYATLPYLFIFKPKRWQGKIISKTDIQLTKLWRELSDNSLLELLSLSHNFYPFFVWPYMVKNLIDEKKLKLTKIISNADLQIIQILVDIVNRLPLFIWVIALTWWLFCKLFFF